MERPLDRAAGVDGALSSKQVTAFFTRIGAEGGSKDPGRAAACQTKCRPSRIIAVRLGGLQAGRRDAVAFPRIWWILRQRAHSRRDEQGGFAPLGPGARPISSVVRATSWSRAQGSLEGAPHAPRSGWSRSCTLACPVRSGRGLERFGSGWCRRAEGCGTESRCAPDSLPAPPWEGPPREQLPVRVRLRRSRARRRRPASSGALPTPGTPQVAVTPAIHEGPMLAESS